jgi:hypothetical protein
VEKVVTEMKTKRRLEALILILLESLMGRMLRHRWA